MVAIPRSTRSAAAAAFPAASSILPAWSASAAAASSPGAGAGASAGRAASATRTTSLSPQDSSDSSVSTSGAASGTAAGSGADRSVDTASFSPATCSRRSRTSVRSSSIAAGSIPGAGGEAGGRRHRQARQQVRLGSSALAVALRSHAVCPLVWTTSCTSFMPAAHVEAASQDSVLARVRLPVVGLRRDLSLLPPRPAITFSLPLYRQFSAPR